MNDFKEQVVIITGAVGNLGHAVAQAFWKTSARTVLVDRSQDRLRTAFPQLANSNEHFLAGEVDLMDEPSLARMVQETVQRFGRVDTLINTVGGYRGGKPVHEADPADWDAMFNVNVRTAIHCARAVVPQMLQQQQGRIVNVASRDGLAGSANFAAYSASKSAVLRLTESMAAELKASNINVNCIMPGTIDTPQNRAALPGADFSKWVEPAEIAEVILFLASDASRAITGAAIPVYGKA